MIFRRQNGLQPLWIRLNAYHSSLKIDFVIIVIAITSNAKLLLELAITNIEDCFVRAFKSGILLKKIEENGINMRVLLVLMCSM